MFKHLTLELGEIYNETFEKKYESVMKEGKVKKSAVDALNKYCLKSIEYFEKLIESVVSSTNKELLENTDTLRTIITAKFNVAKNYSRYQTNDTKEKVSFLAKSLESYKWILKFMNDKLLPKGALPSDLAETMKSCQEMCQLLPSKIDRVNQGIM
jgi:KIF-1 binding protein C terminal.